MRAGFHADHSDLKSAVLLSPMFGLFLSFPYFFPRCVVNLFSWPLLCYTHSCCSVQYNKIYQYYFLTSSAEASMVSRIHRIVYKNRALLTRMDANQNYLEQIIHLIINTFAEFVIQGIEFKFR